MYNGKKVVVVMPAYNAEKTVVQTYEEVMAQNCVDLVILVDDASSDKTADIAEKLKNVRVFRNEKNLGYGGNQKICYRLALEEGADVVIMVHPDYQYTPMLIPAMASLYHCVLGSRILGGYSLKGGMPRWKYINNRILTLVENIFLGAKLSEYHTGYRAFSKELLMKLPLDRNEDDFIFDNQMLAQIIWTGCKVAEISCPTKYFPEASSINFTRSVVYGIGCLKTSLEFYFAKIGIFGNRRFPAELKNCLPDFK